MERLNQNLKNSKLIRIIGVVRNIVPSQTMPGCNDNIYIGVRE